ncbi:unnamed protein product [Rhizoctonia solani]|uniref:Nucleolar 27S pre-rRNA processing Urb2/Npa2 C-terminal domain-containing protein n=1 Tax=Rhizoctonia solani TaxID=456999 RepID=A0A8H3HE81_9AGAM|nr:unnamed protein product [Rhizoctonia solani]
MQTAELVSSQEFIRALKAPKDPPRPGGTLKIDLARQAWELETLFIPSKAEVIVEWVLQSLLTGGGESGVLDGKSWKLLADILTRPNPNLNSTTWLNGVINRVTVWPIFTQLLRILGSVPGSDCLGVATAVARVLLPPAALKANCDAVAGCFWEVLGLFAAQHDNETLLSALELSDIVVSTFESSFSNYSNKKKIAVALVDHHLDSWLRQSKPCHSENTLSKFRHRLFDVGSSIIFTPEYTRSIFQHSDTHPVLLATASSPRIFTVYVSALRTHKLSVFLDQNNSGGLVKRIRGAARELFARSVAERDWSVVAQLVQSAEGLQVVDDEWAQDLGALVASAVQALDNEWTEEQTRIGAHVCSTLACILRLNFDVVEPFTERLLSGLCDAPWTVLAGAGTVFQLLLDYHSKARTLAGFLPHLASAGSREFYRAACVGPVFDPAFTARLRRSVSAFITPGQILPCTQQLLSDLASNLTVEDEPPRKKQRTSSGGNQDNERRAVHVALASRLVVDVLMSLPVKTLRPDVLEQLGACVDAFDGVLSDTIGTLVNVRLSWANQLVLAAALRIRYALRQSRCPVRTRNIPKNDVMEETSMLRMIEDGSVSGELVTEIVRVLTQGQRSKEHICGVWGTALARVQRDAENQQDLSWNGSLAHTENHVWFPLWVLLLDRHLGIIESNLSAEQLRTMLNLFITMSRAADNGGAVTSAGLFDKTVGLAQFWEMPNIRKTLNDKIVHDTSSLDDADLHKALKAIRKGKVSKQAGSHDIAISMYYIAALAPPDYLDRSVKTALLSRAPCADVLATRSTDRAAVRVVLRQLSSGSTALPEEYVRYLLDPQLQAIRESPSTPQDADDALSVLTMSFRVYSRLAKDTSTPDGLVAVLRAVETLQLFDLPHWDDPSAVISIRATLSLLNTILETWGMKSTLPDEIHAPVAKILQQIFNRVEQTQQAVTDLLIEAARLLQSCEPWFQQGPPIDAFSRSEQALTFVIDGAQNSRRARRFLRTLLSQNSFASEALLRLLTQEIQHADEDVRLLIAAFTLNAQSHNNGTSKARRRTTTAVLHALAQLPQLTLFQEACANFVADICTDRANALTAPDIAAIWILLDRATSSMEETFLRAYSSIVVALHSLVRFRRDLLTPTLAQLAALLTRLIRILRLRTSHAIGAPQRSVESQASLAGKATELARLLVGLSTKTVVRLPGSNKPEQAAKAESLARPFARHAPYLLVAYAESAADMSTAVRNALKPGLFALCVMCGTPARDMIMVTMLDTVEKEVFGALWREWEGQKYTGKG